jgi:hypothetical protein
LFVSVKVGQEINRRRVQIFQQGSLRKFRQSTFRISHGRGRISVDRTKVTVTINQGMVRAKVLCEAYERIVNGHVTVRMELSQHFSDHAGTFAVTATGRERELIHGVKNTTMDGLETVASVGNGSAENDRQGVLQE